MPALRSEIIIFQSQDFEFVQAPQRINRFDLVIAQEQMLHIDHAAQWGDVGYALSLGSVVIRVNPLRALMSSI